MELLFFLSKILAAQSFITDPNAIPYQSISDPLANPLAEPKDFFDLFTETQNLGSKTDELLSMLIKNDLDFAYKNFSNDEKTKLQTDKSYVSTDNTSYVSTDNTSYNGTDTTYSYTNTATFSGASFHYDTSSTSGIFTNSSNFNDWLIDFLDFSKQEKIQYQLLFDHSEASELITLYPNINTVKLIKSFNKMYLIGMCLRQCCSSYQNLINLNSSTYEATSYSNNCTQVPTSGYDDIMDSNNCAQSSTNQSQVPTTSSYTNYPNYTGYANYATNYDTNQSQVPTTTNCDATTSYTNYDTNFDTSFTQLLNNDCSQIPINQQSFTKQWIVSNLQLKILEIINSSDFTLVYTAIPEIFAITSLIKNLNCDIELLKFYILFSLLKSRSTEYIKILNDNKGINFCNNLDSCPFLSYFSATFRSICYFFSSYDNKLVLKYELVRLLSIITCTKSNSLYDKANVFIPKLRIPYYSAFCLAMINQGRINDSTSISLYDKLKECDEMYCNVEVHNLFITGFSSDYVHFMVTEMIKLQDNKDNNDIGNNDSTSIMDIFSTTFSTSNTTSNDTNDTFNTNDIICNKLNQILIFNNQKLTYFDFFYLYFKSIQVLNSNFTFFKKNQKFCKSLINYIDNLYLQLQN